MTRTTDARPTFSLVLPSDGIEKELTSIINEAYAETEGAEFWKSDVTRTSVSEVKQFIAAKRFYKLMASEDGGSLVGCITLTRHSETDIELGMLAVSRAGLGRGYGSLLMQEAEREARDRCQASKAQLSLLIPVDETATPTFKTRLKVWYERMGYVKSKTLTLEESYPHLCGWTVMDCQMLIFEKVLIRAPTT